MSVVIRVLSTFLGSDVFSHYTARYTWMTNQMAHAMMGFCFSSLWAVFGWHPAWFMIWPVIKDLGDFTVDMHREGVFRVDAVRRRELLEDWFVDDFFWASGVALTLLFRTGSPGSDNWGWWIGVLGAIVVGALLLGRYMLKQKDALDRSALPYNFRLPNYAKPIDPASVQAVESFIAHLGGAPPKHLIITGPFDSGRTSLAVGIGSGVCARREKTLYMNAYDLFAEVAIDHPEHSGRKVAPWTLKETKVLVVDDLYLSAFGPDKGSAVWQAASQKDDFQQLKQKGVVWVLNEPEDLSLWQSFLTETLALDSDRLIVIKLEGDEE